MDAAQLERLRRFALSSGLALITYLAAGVTVEPGASISAFGVPFHVARPDLLPIGLALAALYGAARFHYYGVMLAMSPHRKRRDLLDGLDLHDRAPNAPKKIPTYWGPVQFKSLWLRDKAIVQEQVAVFPSAFPKFARARVRARLIADTDVDEDGEYTVYCVKAVIPRRCRAAAVFEDLDYTAPVWLNVLALTFFVWVLVF